MSYVTDILLIEGTSGSNSASNNNLMWERQPSGYWCCSNIPRSECTEVSGSSKATIVRTPHNSDWYFKYWAVFRNSQERWLITLITHYCNLNSSLPSAIYRWNKTSGISLKQKEPTGTQHLVETEGWEIPKLFSCLLAVLSSFAFESIKENHLGL